METIQEMKRRHQREIRELQTKCPHKEVSDWMRECWAPGHSTAFEVKVCRNCEKVIARRTKCRSCGKITEAYREGRGTADRPLGTYFCLECV